MPNGLAMGLLSRLAGMTQVGATVAANPSVTLPDGSSIPSLTVTAGRGRHGEITIAVVNSDMTNAVRAGVGLRGAPVHGRLAVSTMAGASPFATNTPDDPNQVAVQSEWASASGHMFTHVFPAHSVTVISWSPTGRH